MPNKMLMLFFTACALLCNNTLVWAANTEKTSSETTAQQIKHSRGKIGTLAFQRWTNKQGMQVLFARTHNPKIIDVRLVFDAGSARDGQLPGLAKLTNGLIFEGAKGLSDEAIARRFESLGVEYGSSSYRDMAIVELRMLSEPNIRDQAFALLQQILAAPSFTQKAFTRDKNNLILALKKVDESPDLKATLAFYRALYDRHPYAQPSAGTRDSLEKITRADVKNFYQRYYVAGNAVLAMVGDIDENEVRRFADQLTRALGAGAHAPPLPDVHYTGATKKYLAHQSTQTTIMLGMPVLKRGDPDYYALYLGNHILGGNGFSARLMQEVRIKRGLTYGIGSRFSQMRAQGPFSLSLTTKNSSAKEALTVIHQVLNDFITHGPTEAEIKQAKQNIEGSFPLQAMNNKDILAQLAVMGFYNLDNNYLNIFLKKIKALHRQDIQQTFTRRFNPQRLSTIIVGPQAVE